MATNKTFAVAGVSTIAGSTKIRFMNDSTRVKILIKNGHTDIDTFDLPHEMTKTEIASYLTEIGYGAGKPEVLEAIKDLAKKNPASKQASQGAVEMTTATTA